MESVKKSIDERAQHKREYDSWVNERQIQTTKDKVDTGNAVDASLVNTESIATESKEQDTSSRSRNDAHANDADIRPIYDEEPMAEVQTTDDNVSATGQQHTEQPEFNNEGKVDQNVEQCHDTCPLPAKLTDNQTTELSNQSLESENIRLKKTVAQFQKDFLRMEAHCVNLELKYQNQALKEGQHGQFSKVKSNEAKVKHDIDVIETINIELEHKVAKLLKENETLKRHYKEMFDSIKTTRAKTIEHTTSLIAQNAEFIAQIQKKGFAIAALKNELRKLTGNSVNTKFTKPSILGKPVGQPLKNQSVVRQPTAFKSERPKISKPRFASQVDVNNNLLKPVTTHHLPKRRESAPAKPQNMIAPSSSRYSLKYRYIVQSYRGRTQSLVAEKTDISANRASRNFDLMITLMTFEHSSSSLGHQYQASVFIGMMSVHISSGLVLHQMTSDHNRSELGIQDHSNEPSSSKLVPKVVPLAVKTATSRQELELLFHHHIAMPRTTGQTVVTATSIPFKCSIYEDILSRKLKIERQRLPLTLI
ncbi:hypothetical protein Tco_0169582 [Tanacetum coccineum]